MSTLDHGLEVIRKSSEKYLGSNSESIIRVKVPEGISVGNNPFSPPSNCDYVSRSALSNVETYIYKQGGSLGTVLKTIVITYTDATLNNMVSAEVS